MQNRRALLSTISALSAVAIAGCSDGDSAEDSTTENDSTGADSTENNNENAETTVEDVKNQAREIEYDNLMRNSDQYEGEYIHFPTAQVTQVLGEEGEFQLRVYVSEGEFGWEDDVFIRWGGERFLEDDLVEIWGEFTGLLTYETTLGSERTIPDVTAADMEIIEQASEPEPTVEDIEITEDELVIDEGEFSTDVYVEGIATNNADSEASFVTIQVKTYDSAGNQLESYSDSTSNLAADSTWAFRVDIFSSPDEFNEYSINVEDASF